MDAIADQFKDVKKIDDFFNNFLLNTYKDNLPDKQWRRVDYIIIFVYTFIYYLNYSHTQIILKPSDIFAFIIHNYNNIITYLKNISTSPNYIKIFGIDDWSVTSFALNKMKKMTDLINVKIGGSLRNNFEYKYKKYKYKYIIN